MTKIITSCKEIMEVLNYYAKDHEAVKLGRVDLDEMARKFAAYGTVVELTENDTRIGFAAFYHNDRKMRRAFLSMIMVKPEFQEHGYGAQLLERVEQECIGDGMKALALEVRTDNQDAIHLYKDHGFVVANAFAKEKWIMEKRLSA